MVSEENLFGHLVRDRRSALGLTQAELSNRAGCAPITIRKIEAGTLRPSFQMAERLALCLNIPEEEELAFVRLAREKKPTTPIPKPTPAPSEIGLSDLSGRAVKGFHLGELIGSGGFGVVYKAIQLSVNREVAVKIILPKFANQPEFIRRFESEAQLVARLEHPHIVPLYDYWREPDAAYLILRLLKGGSLEERIRQDSSSLEDRLRIMWQVGLALDEAHRNKVVHRDVKPANVMLDESGNAYLTDFGIAKILGGSRNRTIKRQTYSGSPAYLSPEQILDEPIRLQSDIYSFGMMAYEIITGEKPVQASTTSADIHPQFQVQLPSVLAFSKHAPIQLDEIIQKATQNEPENRYQTMLELLKDLDRFLTAQKNLGASVIPEPQSELSPHVITSLKNPFLGLRPFTEAEAGTFFGRNDLVQELLRLLADETDLARFVTVIGPSGSGKSSVVNAGLIPALRLGGLPDSENWFIIQMTPGSNPWKELAAALLKIATDPPENIIDQLMINSRGLLRTVHHLLPNENETELLLVIDQFEELFTQTEDEQTRNFFMDSLVTAVLDPTSRLRVILTLRADFTDRPLQYADFGELMSKRMVLVLPLFSQELTDAITKPLIQLGLEVEPALVTTIVQDVSGQPGMLPLLQYTLTELFEQRNGRSLTLAAYEEIGGISGALGRRADEIYQQLDPADQAGTRQLFLRLVTLGEGVEDTRRRVLQSELLSLQSQRFSKTLRVLELYGRYRLLTFDHDPFTREATAELAHEALLREWPRLRSWLADSREDVRRQRQVTQAARQWQASQQDESYLLRGSRLTEFEAWWEAAAVALTPDERVFLESSIAARDQRHAEEEKRRQRELETARKLAAEQTRRAEEQTRAAQTLRQRAFVLAGALVLAAFLAVAAYRFSRSATDNANLAATREADAVANLILASTSEAIAIQNANLAVTRQAEVAAERDRADAERAAAVDAQRLAENEANFRATAEAEAVLQRDVAQEQTNLAISRELSQAADVLLESDPELSMLLAMQAINTAYTKQADEALHNALQRSRARLRISDENTDFDRAIYTPDGSKIVMHGSDETLQLRVAATGELITSVPVSGKIYWQQFDESGRQLLTVTSMREDGPGLRLFSWDINTQFVEEVQTFNAEIHPLTEAILNPDGTLLAFGNVNNQAELWDVTTGERLFILARFSGLALKYDFDAGGTRLIVGGDNGEIEIFDVPASLAAGVPVQTTAFDHSAAGTLIQANFSPSADQIFLAFGGASLVPLEIWDISTPNKPQFVRQVGDGELYADGLSPDGTLVISRSALGRDGSLVIWDFASGEPLFTLEGHKNETSSAMFSPDGKNILTASLDGTVRIWDASVWSGGEVQTGYSENGGMDIQISPDQQLIAFGSGIGPAAVLNRQTLQVIHILEGDYGGVYRTSFHPDGTRLATVGEDNVIRIWDVATGQLLRSWVGHELGNSSGGFFPGVLDVAFSPDGSRLATASSDSTAKIWDAETGEELLILDGHTVGLHSLEYSPDGLMIATSSDIPENSVRVWDAQSGVIIHNLATESRAWALAFSPDSQLLATGGTGGFVSLWDLDTGTELYALPIQPGTIGTILFTPEGDQLITGSGELVRLWDVARGEEIKTIAQTRLWNMAITADGRYLYGGNFVEGIIKVFTLNTDDTIAIARQRLTRSLTDAECKQYLHLERCPEN